MKPLLWALALPVLNTRNPCRIRPLAMRGRLARCSWRLQHTRIDDQRLLRRNVARRDYRPLLSELLGTDWRQHPVLESATVIFGVRDLDPAEQQRFQQSQIRMVKW